MKNDVILSFYTSHVQAANAFTSCGDYAMASQQMDVAEAIRRENPQVFISEVTPLPTRKMQEHLRNHGLRIVRRAAGFRIGKLPVFDGGDAA